MTVDDRLRAAENEIHQLRTRLDAANELLLGAVENGPWALITDPQLRQIVGEYIADTCHSIAAAAGLDEAMERAHDMTPQRLATSLPVPTTPRGSDMAQDIPTAAELAAAQARLDAYNAATGSNLKLEQPTSAIDNLAAAYEAGRMHIEEANFECCSGHRVARRVPAALAEVKHLSDEMEHRRVEVAELRSEMASATVVVAPDARDRLARHMFVTALDPDLHDAGEVVWGERRGNPRDVKRAYTRADELLAVITGTKG